MSLLFFGNSGPVCTVAPAITGSTALGDTLTRSLGSWNGSPTSFTSQWYRDDNADGIFTPIGPVSSGKPTIAGHALTQGPGGPALKMHGVAVWGVQDYITGAFGASQYAARATVCHTVKAWGANVIRLRVLAASYEAQTVMTKAQFIQQIVDWQDAAEAEGLYLCVCWWDGLDGDYSGANWATQYSNAFPMMTAVVNALGPTNPWVIYEPFNEPNNVTEAQWLAAMQATVAHFRSLSYTGVLLIDTNVWSHAYNHTDMTALETTDAARAGMGGQHQLIFAKHDYANEFPNPDSGFDTTAWPNNNGGTSAWNFAAHMVWESEFGNYNGSPASVHYPWSAAACDWMAAKLNDGTLCGATAFLFGAWLDTNAMTTSDNVTVTQWGGYVRDRFIAAVVGGEGGDTGATHQIVGSDIGCTLMVIVTATNANGTSSAESNHVYIIVPGGGGGPPGDEDTSFQLQLELGFGYGPGDPISTIVWVDASDYLISGGSERGRSFELDRFETGHGDIMLDSSDRRFEPGYAGSPYYPNIQPLCPARLTCKIGAFTSRMFTGFVERWPVLREGIAVSSVRVTLVDGFDALAGTDIVGVFPSVRSDAAVAAVLDAAGWPTADRTLGSGIVTIAPHSYVDTDGQKALPRIQEIDKTEAGATFIDKAGKVVFQGRAYRQNQAIVATFSDQATVNNGKLPYANPVITFDRDRLTNEVKASTVGDLFTAIETDPTSGMRRTITEQLDTELAVDATAWAQYRLLKYSTPVPRFEQLTVELLDGSWPSLVATVMTIGISDLVLVEHTPNALNTSAIVPYLCNVEKIIHQIPERLEGWTVRLQLSPADITAYLTLNDSGDAGTLDIASLAF